MTHIPEVEERLVEEAKNHIWGYACDTCSATGMIDGHKCTSCGGCGITNWNLDWLRSALSQARQEGREEAVKYCKKEMYKALDEVAQYGHKEPITLVNKADIKVWINALTTEGK